MTLITEEKRKELNEAGIRVPHVNESCIGCGACVAIAGDVFTLSDEGVSVVKELPSYENLGVDDSIAACPVNAISWK